jgi:hypothetical protein
LIGVAVDRRQYATLRLLVTKQLWITAGAKPLGSYRFT